MVTEIPTNYKKELIRTQPSTFMRRISRDYKIMRTFKKLEQPHVITQTTNYFSTINLIEFVVKLPKLNGDRKKN